MNRRKSIECFLYLSGLLPHEYPREFGGRQLRVNCGPKKAYHWNGGFGSKGGPFHGMIPKRLIYLLVAWAC